LIRISDPIERNLTRGILSIKKRQPGEGESDGETDNSESKNLAEKFKYRTRWWSVDLAVWRHVDVTVWWGVDLAIRWNVDITIWRYVDVQVWWLSTSQYGGLSTSQYGGLSTSQYGGPLNVSIWWTIDIAGRRDVDVLDERVQKQHIALASVSSELEIRGHHAQAELIRRYLPQLLWPENFFE